MDNSATQTPSTSSQPTVQPIVSSLPEPPNRRWPLWLAGGLTVLTLGITVGVFSAKFLNQSPNLSQLPPASTQSPTLTPTHNPTADWKTYENTEHGYAVKYPSDYKLFFDGKTPIIMKPGGEREGTGAFSFYRISFRPLDTSKELRDLVTENINTTKQVWGVDSPEVKSISPIYETIVGNLNGLSFDMVCVGYCHNIFINKDATKSFQITVINANQEVKNMYQSEVDQILSTFKFTDSETAETPARNIVYKKTPGWSDFKSNTGYSLQIPPSFSDVDGSGEEFRDNACFMFFGNNAGGIISAKAVPYSGGSRRQLYGIQPGYDYRFEEALIQNSYKSLIIEAGPIGDSGSGSGIVIPVGNNALIVSRSNVAKDNPEFNSLIQSIKIDAVLNREQCGK